MQSKRIHNNFKNIDSYSMLICSKYFKTSQDYSNIICIQTQYLYTKDDTKIEGINNYEIWYIVDYTEYTKLYEENIKFHIVKYSLQHEIQNNGIIPFGVTEICEELLTINNVKELIIPSTVKKLCDYCFSKCTSLTFINISSSITSIPKTCFQCCLSLQSINIPNSVISFGISFFCEYISLSNITLPTSLIEFEIGCFSGCTQLIDILEISYRCF
ncbi:hypothetical protein QTN25_008212 [Entamoeba marina]